MTKVNDFASIEEQALHVAALAYARVRFHPLELRVRIDRARRVGDLLAERKPLTDPEGFQRDELDGALELARLTLLHAGEKDAALYPPSERVPATESLLQEIRACVRKAQDQFSTNNGAVNAALVAFGEIIALVSSCSRMPGEPECSRSGDCPEHGRNRPGQCVTSYLEPKE